ncbi:ferric-chelate reductase 1 -like protein [Brachionus plicatilis]|uniref:Ferric-chelate reductase 1-like protein n=1 Tax=Brachionus plicatilis TaxID=10195 RepID=A0A3M7T817_BRAPC|nr:ferric-chelate reductase 1 -like protein [Brachionus plicatilis]
MEFISKFASVEQIKELTPRYNYFKSYHVRFRKSMLDPKNWPINIKVRRYYEPKKKDDEDSRQVKSKGPYRVGTRPTQGNRGGIIGRPSQRPEASSANGKRKSDEISEESNDESLNEGVSKKATQFDTNEENGENVTEATEPILLGDWNCDLNRKRKFDIIFKKFINDNDLVSCTTLFYNQYITIYNIMEKYKNNSCQKSSDGSNKTDYFNCLFNAKNDTPIDTTGCDKQFGCFRQPSGCDGKNCDYFVSWKNEGDSINFIMSTRASSNNAYLAIGFSKDSTMGDDSVVICFNERINSNDIQLFYNFDSYSDILDLDRPNLGLSELKISQEDNFLSCSFRREKFLDFKDYFDLNKPYYLLIAKGQATLENSKFVPEYHGENRLKSSSPIDFTQTESASVSSSSINLVKAHGRFSEFNMAKYGSIKSSIMAFSWMFLSTLGILFARYYKYLGKNKTLCGVQIWFVFHRPLMLATNWKWTSSQVKINFAHSIIGILTIGISVIQPIFGALRPDKDSPNRPIFNWLHRIFDVSITLATKFFLQNNFWGIMIGWLSWLIILIILLEFTDYKILLNNRLESYDVDNHMK